MQDVSLSEFHDHLPAYLDKVQRGEALRVISGGKVLARVVPDAAPSAGARQRLLEARARARVGDLLAPCGEAWEAEG